MISITLLPRIARYSPSLSKTSFHRIRKLHLDHSSTVRPIVHRQIYPTQSWSRKTSTGSPNYVDLSPESVIQEGLAQWPINKWGWVIYRCTYADDQAWARFRALVESQSHESIAESDAPEIANSLEWTWVEDAATLDGASTASYGSDFALGLQMKWQNNQATTNPLYILASYTSSRSTMK